MRERPTRGGLLGVVLYLLISGDLLYVGVGVLIVGVALAPRRSSVGGAFVWTGVVLIVASAVPIAAAAYVGLVASAATWHLFARSNLERRRRMAAVLPAMAGVIVGLAVRTPDAAALSAKTPIFVIGDSLAAGLGESNGGTWPRLLGERMGASITNLAQPGARLADGVRQANAIPADTPVTVLVELGGNDLLGGRTAKEFERDLRALLGALTGGRRRVVMLELPLMPFQNHFGRIQRRACADQGVTLLPRFLLAGAIALPGHATDGLHLSSAGHEWLATRVAARWTRP